MTALRYGFARALAVLLLSGVFAPKAQAGDAFFFVLENRSDRTIVSVCNLPEGYVPLVPCQGEGFEAPILPGRTARLGFTAPWTRAEFPDVCLHRIAVALDDGTAFRSETVDICTVEHLVFDGRAVIEAPPEL